ncbi:MAG TPA: TRAP transporter small permease [Burkholderiales bacterium]|nr:TRAP transporter small permease [Burkholderiales bacterium]
MRFRAPTEDAIFHGPLGVWAGWVLGTIVAVDLAAMMVLTFFDVSGRKLFTSPIYGAYEITEFMMGVLIFCALPLVTAREGHVTIDIMDHFVPRGAMKGQRIVISLVSAAVLAVIAWRLWILSASHLETNEVTMTLHIPHGPFTRAFSIMAGLATLACLAVAWDYLRGWRVARDMSHGGGAGA